MLQVQPRLKDLHALISKVRGYPITARQLVELAIKENAAPEVIEFYHAFPEDEVFTSDEDLIARSEHLEIMHREEQHQPQEILTAPEED
jgi:hypothetical protein